MSDILPDDERVMVTLNVIEWSKVCAGLVNMYGFDDELYKKIRLAVATGN